MQTLHRHYHTFLSRYGPQGWWPLLDLHGTAKGSNPTKTGSVRGYHRGNYSFPRTDGQRFEICAGAILAQNTAWPNVEKALRNLKSNKVLDPEKIVKLKKETLGTYIHPTGYFNQKAKKLALFSEFYVKLKKRVPRREELLSIWGIGPETADSILLYAYGVPEFVVDAYTQRVLNDMGLITPKASYDKIKEYCVRNLPCDVKTYQEFHALMVEHGKRMKEKKTKCGKL